MELDFWFSISIQLIKFKFSRVFGKEILLDVTLLFILFLFYLNQ